MSVGDSMMVCTEKNGHGKLNIADKEGTPIYKFEKGVNRHNHIYCESKFELVQLFYGSEKSSPNSKIFKESKTYGEGQAARQILEVWVRCRDGFKKDLADIVPPLNCY